MFSFNQIFSCIVNIEMLIWNYVLDNNLLRNHLCIVNRVYIDLAGSIVDLILFLICTIFLFYFCMVSAKYDFHVFSAM